VAVVNIDSDIYQPAKLALDFIKPMMVQESLFYLMIGIHMAFTR
jgi:hypothetical protein